MIQSSSPQLKLVESVGNAPTLTCLQGRCIACLPRPQMKLAGRLRAAPSKLSFGDSVAACWRAACKELVRLPGIAPGPSSLARRHSAVKSQPRKLKGPEAFTLPAHAISTKNKHLLVIYSIPTRGFTAAVSVFRGTPPPKPLKCKFWLNTSWRASLRPLGIAHRWRTSALPRLF